ncbi:MAG: hypothetical protein ACE5ES_00710 [Candidatus Nanoarchaeia archaeon]
MPFRYKTVVENQATTDTYVAFDVPVGSPNSSLFIKNTHGTNSITYKVDAIVNGIVVNAVTDTALAAGATAKHDFSNVGWERLQLSIRATTGGSQGTVDAYLGEQ